jgi:hypothetical protein
MKSYFLDHVSSLAAAEAALDAELPGQRHPWLLLKAPGEAIAYIGVGTSLDEMPNSHIVADVSGCHYEEDKAVLELLERLQRCLGGSISSDA